ncbi:hypothetical protein [uncultured Corynebacterium sp.]|uniref:hypothetical protein n=1 Tax=uncultured Corynebacterium sp. TaxID=159447 RepID=UPI002591D9B0|nr:hypothetical protein [uncultured Corynebacterium sp.]
MIDPHTTISGISTWSLNHPKPVQKVLECCEALEQVHFEAPGWRELNNPKTVAQAIEANARFNATEGGATFAAINTARNTLATKLIETVSDNLEDYLEQWEVIFNEAADTYEEAVEKLPTEFTANQVTTFEPEQFSAFVAAREAVAVLHDARRWLMDVSRVIPGQFFNSSQWAKEFLLLEPDTVATFASIQLADTRGADDALRSVDPVLLKAVHAGATLSFRLPAEAMDSVRSWEEQRQGMADEDWARVRAGLVA